jgi:hypothetical protein
LSTFVSFQSFLIVGELFKFLIPSPSQSSFLKLRKFFKRFSSTKGCILLAL